MGLKLEQYKRIVENTPNLIWVSGVDAKCYYFNQTWLDFRGRSLGEEYGNGWFEDGVHPDDKEECMKIYLENFNQKKRFNMVYRLQRHDGEYRWIDDTGAPFYDEAGNFAGFVGSCVDITERIRGQQYKERATQDGLTGIFNRQYFFDLMQEEYFKSVENKTPLSVIMFDVDKFKSINDNYGHLIGDQVLKSITEAVNKVIRDFDLFARYGGDEFVVGLPGTSTMAASKVAVRILESIEKVKIKKEPELAISCSIGTVTLNKENNFEELIDKADKALYSCKNDGGNCVVNFNHKFA
ncbi:MULTISPECIES: sensor domain-containing diguanylate cyclase [Halanaerobium]|jgi:diguanylate cyclase (GGDEF)-like protein/PAS domain S-box-containing protein|uniref:PAS domain S-box-containing protein/diguanylate cyclase (GGDEF) domain-containing protein n=1 Tax=Halanaerobium kushneri TaxID=56779 RepID=A0A1N7A8V4_9FIRM|nr:MULTISPECIES: sensor domain-containing diguanylate cyclase [Halanaerobium]RCW54612.1 PAS domain S-box-containing protein/diguanylate cyclase (GGDEF)-like protein [Halanaerobium sp. ST460_2HS_T2]SIR35532.1 PAS domain S-box-containing protein/diguanylate cyclase (GGDEF) domain-containing protein [Halanaerobium kushneri]